MKKILTSAALLLVTATASAQIVYQFGENDNVRYIVNNNGTFFHNYATSVSGYNIPKDSATGTIYTMDLLAMGLDVNNQLKGALSGYTSSDFFPGPIAFDYNAVSYFDQYSNSLWEMTKAEIDYHIAHYQDLNYIPAISIMKWPGNGNTANEEAAMLAPFTDLNGNGIYEPVLGDYPAIRGDKAIYSIVNDGAGLHPSGADRIGVEIHLMFYQYLSNSEELNNTTFINATVYNRGTQALHDFHFGAFIDFDLGSYNDDYIGTMTAKNLAYVYNGDLNDEPYAGRPGFGVLPPAAGVMALNKELYSHVSIANVNQAFPSTPAHYYNLLNGKNIDGSLMLDGQSQPTRYAYYGDSTGWTEVHPGLDLSSPSNPSGDRKSFISMSSETFAPHHQLCYDFAVIYGHSNAGGLFSSVDSLEIVATHMQDFYDQQQFVCASGAVGLEDREELAFTVYPNPATTELHFDGLQQGDFRIVTTDGKTVLSGSIENQSIGIGQLTSGYYLLVAGTGGYTKTISFIKQ